MMDRPVLRYFGGKHQLAPWVVAQFPPHKVYVEPFSGAASVLMQKSRANVEILNDVDDEIVNVFRVLRDRGGELERALRLTPFSETEYVTAYNDTRDDVERARRTIVKSMMGVGADSIHRRSGFRMYPHNRAGRDKIVSCASEWAAYSDAIATFVERLRGVDIRCGDARDVIRQWDGPHTLHYADPPYVQQTRSGSGGYRHELSDDEHRALIATLNECEGAVVLSGYRSDLYDELLADWHRIDREFRGRTESLWLKNVGNVQGTIFDAIGSAS